MSMLRIICFIAFIISSLNAKQRDGPQAIKNLYEKIVSDPGRHGQNITLIKETVHDDWGTRPNPLKPNCKGSQCGPGAEGMKTLFNSWAKFLPDIYIEREQTLFCSDSYICGDKVVVLSKFGSTIGDLPSDFTEFPMFPGIDPSRIVGKKFETLAIDIQIIKDEKIKRSWHFEDWVSALEQVLHDKPKPLFSMPFTKPGKLLTEIPQSIKNFYDKMLSDPSRAGQNLTLIGETFHADWQSRPNGLNPTGKGPGASGVKTLMGGFGALLPDLKFERQHTLLCGDRVTVLSKMSGTIPEKLPQGIDHIPFFPGIPLQKVLGKKIETMALDIQFIKDGKIKQSYHIEDFATAADQVVNGNPPPDFGFDADYIN